MAEDRQSEIIACLEEDIIFGRLAPDSRLVEDTLMQRFGVTRHFIRQALVQLERVGIVIKEPNKGARVRSFSLEEVTQIYAVREMLQRQAALLIPLPASPKLIDELYRIHEIYSLHVDNGYLRGVHEMNDKFHSAIFSACGNPYLVRSIQEYMRLSYAIRANSLAIPEKLRISRTHHAIMIELLQGKDNWSLAQLCVDHILPSKLDYIERQKSHHDEVEAVETTG
jgi:DNA-binding GntR family transcriptional regulator